LPPFIDALSLSLSLQDDIRPDWEAKLASALATLARRANRRIIMRQVGERLIPIGVSSSRVGADLPQGEGAGGAIILREGERWGREEAAGATSSSSRRRRLQAALLGDGPDMEEVSEVLPDAWNRWAKQRMCRATRLILPFFARADHDDGSHAPLLARARRATTSSSCRIQGRCCCRRRLLLLLLLLFCTICRGGFSLEPQRCDCGRAKFSSTAALLAHASLADDASASSKHSVFFPSHCILFRARGRGKQ
jgi:hypothetical protein